MKMVKKILLGLVVTGTILVIAGCKMQDDPENAITGSGSNYKVDYENTKSEEYRAYESTSLKHAGALVKITFDNPEECANSKMGVIFDLKENADNKNAKDFYIIGLGSSKSSSYDFYVSKYTGIVDIQAKNFGASTDAAAGEPKEVEYFKLSNSNIKNLPSTFYVYCKANIKGEYEFALLKGEPTDGKEMKINDLDLTDLPQGVSLIDLPKTAINGCSVSGNIGKIANAIEIPESGKESDIKQNRIAVYARIDANATLKGSWKFCGTYQEAEEIEE